MKLPGINYRTQVQSLGRKDPGLAMRLSEAQRGAVNELITTSTNIYNQVEEQRALNYWSKTERQMNDIENDFKTRPATSDKQLKDDYSAATGQIKLAADEELGGLAKQIWQGKFGKRSEESRFKLTTGNALNLAKQERDNTKNEQSELARTDLPAAIKNEEESPLFSDIEKKENIQEYTKINEKSSIEASLNSGDPEDMQAQMDRLKKGETVLDEKEVRQRIGWLKTAKTTALADTVAAETREKERVASDLTLAVDDGSAGPPEIDNVFNTIDSKGKRGITSQKRAELIMKWRKKQKDGAAEAKQDAKLSNLLAIGQPADPKDKDVIEAVDRRYQVAFEQVQQLPPVEKRIAQTKLDQEGIDLAARTNILPKQMKAALRTFAFTGSPDDVARQANIYEKLQVTASNTIDDISPETRSVYEQTSAQMRAGRSALDSVTKAKENVMAPPEVKTSLVKAYKEFDSKWGEGNSVYTRLEDFYKSDDQFDLEIIGYPKPTTAQVTAYQSLEFADFQNNGGDIEQAKISAFNEFKRVYSGTKMSNKDGDVRVMAYAPERVYKLPADELTRQLRKFAKPSVIDAKTVFITSDGITSRETPKTYKVWHENEFGPVEAYNTNGTPLRWTPSVEDYNKQKMTEAQKAQDVIEEQRLEEDDEDFNLGGAGGQVGF